jgi:ketosteroid isomerase-like protein
MAKSETSGQIQALIEARAAAIRAKDVARALSVYTPGVVNFDLPPPLRFVGAEALDPKGLGGWLRPGGVRSASIIVTSRFSRTASLPLRTGWCASTASAPVAK